MQSLNPIQLRLNKGYLFWTIVLFVVEVAIALFLHDAIIRPYIGDVLVTMLVYCFVKSFITAPEVPTLIGALLFCYLVEGLQYFKIVKVLGLQHSTLANTVLGTSFAWMDMLAYTCGAALVYLLEVMTAKREH